MSGNQSVFEEAMSKGHSAAWDQQWPRAIACYRAALQEFPGDPTALSSLGFALLQTDKLDEALGLYQRAASVAPGDPAAPEKCGEIFERLGRLPEAAQTYLAVAEIHLKRRDIDKALDNWNRVVYLTPDNLAAHSRLALALERSGKTHPAVLEFLEIARLFQRANDVDKALQAANHALQLEPQFAPTRDALNKLQKGVALQPIQAKGTGALPRAKGTGMLSPLEAQALAMADKQPHRTGILDSAGTGGLGHGTGELAEDGTGPLTPRPPSPLTAAEEIALAQLAELLFEEDADTSKTGASMSAITKGSGAPRDEDARHAQAVMLVGQAISLQTNNKIKEALANYTAAIKAGLDSPALHLIVGALNLDFNHIDEAAKHFSIALSRPDIGVGAHYGLSDICQRRGKTGEALTHLLETLKQVDYQLTADKPHSQNQLAEAYESLTESLPRLPAAQQAELVAKLTQFLTGEGWEERARKTRQSLDANAEGDQITPLAEVFATAGADQVLDCMRIASEQMRLGHWNTAMDQAGQAVHYSPLYLPAHVRMAEILVAEGKTEAAMAKYTAIAETYRMRGESVRAARIMQEVMRLNPLDVEGRARLVKMLTEQGQTEPALTEYIELADTYYQLADMDTARATYAEALSFAQHAGADRTWLVKILHPMGDLDMQRLAWREALREYEQINALVPGDEKARQAVVELHFRLGNTKQAMAELDNYLRLLLNAHNRTQAITVLEDLAYTYADEAALIARLARLYQDEGRKTDAVAQYDHLVELQTQAGQNAQAAETLRLILSLGPDNPVKYQRQLAQLQTA